MITCARGAAGVFYLNHGIRHTVDMQAESLYEAVLLAVRAFRKADWIRIKERDSPIYDPPTDDSER